MRKAVSVIYYLSGLLVLAVFLFFRFKLATTRYFDVDEFAHLHWGYSYLLGEVPYKNFFLLFPPYFLFPVAALLMIFGRTIQAIISVRILIFVIFILTIGVLFFLYKKLSNTKIALLATIVFCFLPIPYDKMIEIRPDLVSLFLSVLGILLYIIYIDSAKTGVYFSSGLSLGLSLAMLPKTLFFPVPVFIAQMYFIITAFKKGKVIKEIKKHLPFWFGFTLPFILLIIFLMKWDVLSFGIYSMTKMSNNIAWVLARKFYMHTNLFFYPNDTYYGEGKVGVPLITNLLIYVIGMTWGIARFLGSLSYKDAKKSHKEFIVSASYILNMYAFMKIFPLKHAQYLMFMAVFVTYYFSEAVFSFLGFAAKKLKRIKAIQILPVYKELIVVLLIFFLFKVGSDMYKVKINWTNNNYREKLQAVLNTIDQNESIFDLTGETVFYPNGYYFCCIPYGQYEEVLMFSMPNIERVMNEKDAKYVYTQSIDRLNVIPPMQKKYILDNYDYFWPDGSMLVRKEK